MFLSLDGIDGCGKSTQCRRLVDWLVATGHPATLCIDPGGTSLGVQLRQLLLHSQGHIVARAEALLFMASRAQLVHEVIFPALKRGEIVVCDRFTLANVVYQGHGSGLDVDALWLVGRMATGDLFPDRTFVLDLPVELAAARRGRPADRVESRPDDYHERVRQGFLAEAQRWPKRITVVDATPDADTVQKTLRALVEPLLG